MRKRLNALLSFAFLLLAACSPRAQTANTAQEFMDTKHPGVVGAISDAVGYSTGNQEVDAAVNAAGPIRELETADKLQAEMEAARDAGDTKKAERALSDLKEIDRTTDVEVYAFGVAIQLGEPNFVDRYHVVRDIEREDLRNAQSRGHPTLEQLAYAAVAIFETERALHAINQMNLTSRQRHDRQRYAAFTLSEMYRHQAAINRLNGNNSFAEDDERQATKYEQMSVSLSPDE